MTIESVQNSQIKEVLSLFSSKKRKKEKKSIVEGKSEITRFFKGEKRHILTVEKIFICSEVIHADFLTFLSEKTTNIVYVTKKVFSKISYRENSGGAVLVFSYSLQKSSNFTPNKNSRIVILDGLEKPGNIGAVSRTALAADFSAIFVCNFNGDIYNPNIIRASIGSIFMLPLFVMSLPECVDFCTLHNHSIFISHLNANNSCYSINFDTPLALVVGNEHVGVSEGWKNIKNATMFQIPMSNAIDSLNASIAFSIIAFETKRQLIKT